jgi:hypothetical protein
VCHRCLGWQDFKIQTIWLSESSVMLWFVNVPPPPRQGVEDVIPLVWLREVVETFWHLVSGSRSLEI